MGTISKGLCSIALMLALAAGSVSCGKKDKSAEKAELSGKLPVWALKDSSTYNFGSVTEGDTVEHRFVFENKGELPLVITNVTASCGCTTPEWPRDPIDTGKEGSILVRFNSKGKPGPQVKTVTVQANTEQSTHELRITGVVNAKETE